MPFKVASDQVAHSKKSVTQLVRTRLKRIPTLELAGWITASALVLAWLGDITVKRVLVQPYRGIAELIIAATLFFACGWVGVIYILRREFHQLVPIRGRLAVVVGVLVAGVFWMTSLAVLWKVALETWRLFGSG
jgi:hypothetical protein